MILLNVCFTEVSGEKAKGPITAGFSMWLENSGGGIVWRISAYIEAHSGLNIQWLGGWMLPYNPFEVINKNLDIKI